MLSSVGINGATIAMTGKWQPQWVNTRTDRSGNGDPAYGTNEAFNDTLDLDLYRQQLTNVVRSIRSNMPDAVILLVGPGDSIKNKTAPDCRSQQPANLHNVMRIQQSVAKSEGLLYWDWQQFMGGDCAINSWVLRDLARPDKVHLSVRVMKRAQQHSITRWNLSSASSNRLSADKLIICGSSPLSSLRCVPAHRSWHSHSQTESFRCLYQSAPALCHPLTAPQ